MRLAVLFVEEAERLALEGELVKAIISLENACACRGLDPAYVEQLQQIIDTLFRKYKST